MNKESNTYTFIFTIVMVTVVAFGLSFTSLMLKPVQEKNIMVEKKQNILASLNKEVSFAEADKVFDKYIKKMYIITPDGKYEEGNAFDIDLKEELHKPKQERKMPLFIAEVDGKKYFVIPMYGKGLWGPIWGYMALSDDMNTIVGISFGHKTETPGLGAEIVKPKFRKQFAGKKIFDKNGTLIGIKVEKNLKIHNEHQVDAVSGATLTSKGVEAMISNTLENYVEFFKNYKKTK